MILQLFTLETSPPICAAYFRNAFVAPLGRTIREHPDQAPPEPWWSHHHCGKCVWPANLHLKSMINPWCETSGRSKIQEQNPSMSHHGHCLFLFSQAIRNAVGCCSSQQQHNSLTWQDSKVSHWISLRGDRFAERCCSCDRDRLTSPASWRTCWISLVIFRVGEVGYAVFMWFCAFLDVVLICFDMFFLRVALVKKSRWAQRPVLPYQPLHRWLGLRTWGRLGAQGVKNLVELESFSRENWGSNGILYNLVHDHGWL